MDKIYLQMYSFGDFDPLNTQKNLKAAADLGFAGVELFGPNFETNADTMNSWLAEYGLKAISLHADTDRIVPMVPYARALDMQFIGIGMQYLPDEAAVLAFAEKLNDIGRTCRREGLTLTYHNHTQEFKTYHGQTVLELLLENTEPEYLSLELDAGWAAAAGVSPIEFVEKYGDRIKLIHIKESGSVVGVLSQWNPDDMTADENGHPVFSPEQQAEMEMSQRINCPAGEGLADWKALTDLADRKGTAAYIVEREYSYAGERLDCLREDIAYYRSLLLR